jgi:hypothetical protein
MLPLLHVVPSAKRQVPESDPLTTVVRPKRSFTDSCPTAGSRGPPSEICFPTRPPLMARDLFPLGRMYWVQSRWPSLQVARTTAAKRLRERLLRATVIAMRCFCVVVPE